LSYTDRAAKTTGRKSFPGASFLVNGRTAMTLRFTNQQGRELDRVVFTRTAGACLGA
jgi:hypothetical protein